ncbi:MAG: hypothetical protein IJW30_03215 [Clostridia bacterium]|nr:hypothetical protein [Clostridia bacterium]
MNTYYQQNERIYSNNDIFEAYFLTDAKPVTKWKKAADRLLGLLAALISFLTSARVRTFVRVLLVTLSLVGMIGIIGAMESGALGLGAGLGFGALLVSIEVLCLRRRH